MMLVLNFCEPQHKFVEDTEPFEIILRPNLLMPAVAFILEW